MRAGAEIVIESGEAAGGGDPCQSRRAGSRLRSAHPRCYPRTRRRPSTLTSLGMWKRLSKKVIVSRSNRPHGTNPRFQCTNPQPSARGKTRGRCLHCDPRSKAGNTDIAQVSVVTLIELAHGAARAPMRVAAKGEDGKQFIQELLTALPMHPVTVSLALPCRTDRWREPSERHSSSAVRSVDRRNAARTWLQRSHG